MFNITNSLVCIHVNLSRHSSYFSETIITRSTVTFILLREHVDNYLNGIIAIAEIQKTFNNLNRFGLKINISIRKEFDFKKSNINYHDQSNN